MSDFEISISDLNDGKKQGKLIEDDKSEIENPKSQIKN